MDDPTDLWDAFAAKAGLDDGASFASIVEAVRTIPYGRPRERSAEGVVREWRGTCSTKHELLRYIVAHRWPELDPEIVHRVYNLTPSIAKRLFGPTAARVVPPDGVMDVHTYMTVAVGRRRVIIDSTVPGVPWDGFSDMTMACGDGTDVPAGHDPRATKDRLVRQYCDPAARDHVIERLANSAS